MLISNKNAMSQLEMTIIHQPALATVRSNIYMAKCMDK